MSDFQTEADLPKQASVKGLYLLLDGGVVVYVGQSADIRGRLRTHRREAKKPFETILWWACPAESDRLRLEGVLILALLPRFNRGLALGFHDKKCWEVKWKRPK